MKMLATDTSTDILTVAVCDEEAVLAELAVHAPRTHSERLLRTADNLLAQAGLSLAELDALAVGIGPGSFTGLRIGIAAWKGLALGAGLPLVGVPTLDALARLHAEADRPVCPVLDARMGEVFYSIHDPGAQGMSRRFGPAVGPVSELIARIDGPVLLAGDGAIRYRETLAAGLPEARFAAPLQNHARAAAVAFEGLRLLEAGNPGDAGAVRPVYLRKSQAERKREQAGR
ncbi:MAG: tRNA (adenosine(37)-N6)-threonylcarbamoyltransferase complex dimerization subunit type 1 TsaB [Candidatus Hydrogenedentota bacterium]